MVFDGEKCSIPSFCENVFSDDPDTIVPVHEFTKHVKNWDLSGLFDQTTGFTCENKIRKRKHLAADKYISKRFKEEAACGASMPQHLPINGEPDRFYDCSTQRITFCPQNHIFNGSVCIPKPKNAFHYKGLPLFQFDSLNLESWIKPWDYYPKSKPVSCQDPESTNISLYNICSHPDCAPFAFISQIPDMEILLPRRHRAKCKFYENENLLKKEHVNFEYQFWNQKVYDGGIVVEEDVCTPGQKLQTGNFIWDSTIYATCNMDYPFVFCPSTHTQRLIPTSPNNEYFVCEPPKADSYTFKNLNDWTLFEKNEILRIVPKPGIQAHVRRNKGDTGQALPKDGFIIPKNTTINLKADHYIDIEPHYRVTHPPNVVFHYENDRSMDMKFSTPDHAFLVKTEGFTSKHLAFPRYKPINFVESFNQRLYV